MDTNLFWEELSSLKEQKAQIEKKISIVQEKIITSAIFENGSKTAHFENNVLRIYSRKSISKKKDFDIKKFLEIDKNKKYLIESIDDKKVLEEFEENESLKDFFDVKETESKIFESKSK